jgi:signal transduction histidine kinase
LPGAAAANLLYKFFAISLPSLYVSSNWILEEEHGPIRQKSPVLTFGVAVISFLAALTLRLLGWPVFGNEAPFLFFIAAVALASWYGGLAPGILATILGAIAAAILFLPPINAQGTIEGAHILHNCVYMTIGVFISVLMKKLQDALESSSRSERELESRVEERTTELAHANLALQAEKNKFLGILDQMREAVYIVNPQYEIEYTNPAMEREFGPVIGQKCYQYLNGPAAVICPECKNTAVFDGKSFFGEWTSSKNNRVYDCFEAPIVTQSGIKGKLKIMHDITVLKDAEAELLSRHRQIERLSSELLTAQETERMRVSRELHDELGQSLTLVKLKIGMMDMNLPESQTSLKTQCKDVSVQVDQAIEGMRRLSRDLSPATVEALGITIALRRLAADFSKTGNIQISADIDDIDRLLPVHFNIMLFRVLQEGLNNMVKHSGATEATIALKKNEGAICFDLRDNGKGLDFKKENWEEKAKAPGLGLTIMRERVRTLGGTLMIQGHKDAGTRLHFVIPIKDKETGDGELPDNSGR